MSANLRAALAMSFAMFLFALEDMFIKQLAGAMPVGQVIIILGAAGGVVFALFLRLTGQPLWHPAAASKPVLLRTFGEMLGVLGYVSAIALIDLSTVAAVLQAAPLVVTLGAAIFLREPVGWRRWTAIGVGFAGVLLILRPGTDAFEPAALLAVLGVIGLAIRDVATRVAPPELPSAVMAILAYVAVIPVGVVQLWVQGDAMQMPTGPDSLRLAAAAVVGIAAYYAIVGATRSGEVSFVAPFRYSRLVFALIIGALVFGERPDALMLLGCAIVVTSGLYTFAREARLGRLRRNRPHAGSLPLTPPFPRAEPHAKTPPNPTAQPDGSHET